MPSTTLSVKVVPGASADRVVGRYGEAVKVQVTAPPEGGKANKAVIEVLAAALALRSHQLELVRGHGQSRKVVHVNGLDAQQVEARLFPPVDPGGRGSARAAVNRGDKRS